jgi:hypothetical protein
MLREIKWLTIGVVAVFAGAAAVGCGDDDSGGGSSSRKSGEGESCRATADCDGALKCIGQICVDTSSDHSGAGGEGGDGGNEEPIQTISGLGESCRSRIDCELGLACVDQTCVEPTNPFEPTGKECQVVACVEDNDCCDTSPSSKETCDSYASLCASGDKYYCNYYSAYCACDEATKCVDYQCTFTEKCADSADCDAVGSYTNAICDTDSGTCVGCVTTADCEASIYYGVGYVCSASHQCVYNACSTDADCGSNDMKCIENTCVDTRECFDDRDCDYEEQCDDDSGKCVERECTSDRFCADLTSNPNAQCVDKKCVEPCETTYECNGGLNWGTNSELCVDGFCVKAGCETHAECDVDNDGYYQYACLPPGTAPAYND